MSSLQKSFTQRRVKTYRTDGIDPPYLYTYAQIQQYFAPSTPAYLGSGMISFKTEAAFVTAWKNLEYNQTLIGSHSEVYRSLGKEIKVGFGGYNDMVTLTLVQRTSKGDPSSEGVPGTNTLGSTNPGQGYGTYYTVTDSYASQGTTMDGYAGVYVFAL